MKEFGDFIIAVLATIGLFHSIEAFRLRVSIRQSRSKENNEM